MRRLPLQSAFTGRFCPHWALPSVICIHSALVLKEEIKVVTNIKLLECNTLSASGIKGKVSFAFCPLGVAKDKILLTNAKLHVNTVSPSFNVAKNRD